MRCARFGRILWIRTFYDVLFFTHFELEMCNTWLSKTIMLLLAFAIVCKKIRPCGVSLPQGLAFMRVLL